MIHLASIGCYCLPTVELEDGSNYDPADSMGLWTLIMYYHFKCIKTGQSYLHHRHCRVPNYTVGVYAMVVHYDNPLRLYVDV